MTDALTLIPLEKIRETLYVARVEDDRLLQEAEFYLAVRGNMAADRLIERAPLIVKIARLDVIHAVINSGLPGVQLTHQIPPEPVPARDGFQYFSLDTQGPWWDAIKRGKNIAVRVPDEIPDAQLEMYAVIHAPSLPQ